MSVFNLWLTDVLIFLLLSFFVVGMLIVIVVVITGAMKAFKEIEEENRINEDK